ncbi:MAG: c-type cytochrome [Pseudomonadota bacterium]
MQSPTCRRKRNAAYRLPGILAALALSAFAAGCADQSDSGDGAMAKSAERPSAQELFVTYCAACHGTDGSGNGPMASELKVAPTNLRLIKQANNGEFPSLKVRRTIDGRAMPRAHGLPDMPVWGKLWIREGLADTEIQARAISITSYISSIQE